MVSSKSITKTYTAYWSANLAEDSRTAVASALDALRSLSDDDDVQSTSLGTSLARQDQKIGILNALVQVRSLISQVLK